MYRYVSINIHGITVCTGYERKYFLIIVLGDEHSKATVSSYFYK